MNNTVHRLSRTAGFLLAWTIVLFTLAAAVYGMAGNGDLLARKMLLYAPPETTGLPETEYPGVACMTAAYLTGREESFQYTFSDTEGTVWVCFRSHEADHMADCRELIRLDRTVMLLSGGVFLALAGAWILTRRHTGDWCRGLLWGLRVFAAAAAILAVWAVADFDGFFITFHKVAFTNDGWLLNPGTDMLIRLMPEEFFISLGVRGALWALIAPAVLWIAARLGTGSNGK